MVSLDLRVVILPLQVCQCDCLARPAHRAASSCRAQSTLAFFGWLRLLLFAIFFFHSLIIIVRILHNKNATLAQFYSAETNLQKDLFNIRHSFSALNVLHAIRIVVTITPYTGKQVN
jgi:hypothetical protein